MPLTLFFFAAALWALPDGFVAGEDVVFSHFWFRGYFAERIRAGELPLWNPYIYAGHPYLAFPEMAVFYPPTLLFALLPLPAAFTLSALAHVLVAGVGMYVFVYSLTRSRTGGLAAAITYAFGGYMIERLHAGHISYVYSAALLPWLAWRTERAATTLTARDFALAGLALGLLVLPGPPHNAFYASLLVAVYCGGRLLARGNGAWRHAGWLALTALVSVLVSAAQLLPTLELARLSDRTRPSFEFSTFLSYPPSSLVTLLVPHLASPDVLVSFELAAYVGIAGLLLAAMGLRFGRPRGAALALGAITVVGLLLTLGKYTPAFRLLYLLLPPLQAFRVPARAVLLIYFSLCALAGLGAAAASDPGARSQKGRFALASGLAAALTLAAIGLWALGGIASPELVRASLLLLASGAALTAAFRSSRSRIALPALLAVLFFDLYFNESGQVALASARDLLLRRPVEHVFARDKGLFRVALTDGDRGMGLGYQNVDGYAPLAIGSYYRIVHALAATPIDPMRRNRLQPGVYAHPLPAFGRLLNVRYTLTTANQLAIHGGPYYQPRAFLVGQAVVLPDPEAHVNRLVAGTVDIARTVLLDRPLVAPPNTGPPATDDTVEVVAYAPERIELAASARRAAYLVLSELDYPGWVATVDGQPVEIARADGVLRAIAFPAGHHRVVFAYRPGSVRLGIAISLLTLVLGGAWLGRFRKADKTTVSGPAQPEPTE